MSYKPTGRPPGRPRKVAPEPPPINVGGRPRRDSELARLAGDRRKSKRGLIVEPEAPPTCKRRWCRVGVVDLDCPPGADYCRWHRQDLARAARGFAPVSIERVNRVARALRFIGNLVHVKGSDSGKPFNLREWQKRPLVSVFGKRTPEGSRLIRTFWKEIPRKNGKSEEAAALALLMLCGDLEAGAEVYGAATDQDQANLVFDVAAQMVRNDAELSSVLDVIDSRKRIVHKASGSFYRSVAADDSGSHGFNASAIIVDELHAWKNRKLFDTLTTSTGARQQPLTVIITTAGHDRTTICFELHQYAQGVIDGTVDDPTFLPIIYAAPEDADWLDEAVWRAANPALGDFRSIDEMRDFARKAKMIPSRQNTFRQLYLNQWVEQLTRWLAMDAWRRCNAFANGETRITAADLEGAACYGGLDLGQSDDLSAYVRLWCLTDGRRFARAHFWMPQAAVEKHRTRPYDVWRRGGWLTVTPGDVVDYEAVQADVARLSFEAGVRQIAYDKRFAGQMALWLQGQGLVVIDTPQGFGLNEALTNLSDLVVNGKFLHDGNPILDWNASNAVLRKGQRGDVRLDKEKAQEKIDGISALAMANSRALVVKPLGAYEAGVMIL